jgi:hypothetical protein
VYCVESGYCYSIGVESNMAVSKPEVDFRKALGINQSVELM